MNDGRRFYAPCHTISNAAVNVLLFCQQILIKSLWARSVLYGKGELPLGNCHRLRGCRRWCSHFLRVPNWPQIPYCQRRQSRREFPYRGQVLLVIFKGAHQFQGLFDRKWLFLISRWMPPRWVGNGFPEWSRTAELVINCVDNLLFIIFIIFSILSSACPLRQTWVNHSMTYYRSIPK